MHWVVPSENDTATALGKRLWGSRVRRTLPIFREMPVALKRQQAETTVELDALLPAFLDRAFKGKP
jgi:hypothetical protein